MCARQIPRVPERVLLEHVFVNVMAKTQFSSVVVVDGQEVAVSHRCFISLVNCVEQSQNVSADERVVTINDGHNLARSAVLMNTQMNVVQSFLVLFVDNDFDVFLGDASFFKVLFDELACFVGRTVIDVNDVVVPVILHEDWVEVTEIKATFYVVIRRCNDAKR